MVLINIMLCILALVPLALLGAIAINEMQERRRYIRGYDIERFRIFITREEEK